MSARAMILLCLAVSCAFSDVRAQKPDAASLQRYTQEGEKALAEGRYDEAAQAYEKLRELSPGADVYARLGLIYFQQGMFEKAVPVLRQALKLKPALPKIDVLLAMSLSELGRYEEALPALQKGFRRTADPVLKRSSGLHLQRVYTGLRQDDKAVEVALALTRAYPKDPEVLYHAGRLFGNYAYLSTVKLAEVAPNSLWLHLAAGEANESQGRFDAALAEYRQVLSLDPKRPGIHYRLGRVMLARAHKSPTSMVSEPEALKEFEQELQLDPTNANAAYEAGEIHRKSARLDQAFALFSLAVKDDPDFEEALLGLARALISSGKPEQALPHLQKVLSRNARNKVAWYQLSRVYKFLDNRAEQQKALAEFERLREQQARQEEAMVFSLRGVTRQTLEDAKPERE
jgi:tetratricopeptide (TPR) repeat protein